MYQEKNEINAKKMKEGRIFLFLQKENELFSHTGINPSGICKQLKITLFIAQITMIISILTAYCFLHFLIISN